MLPMTMSERTLFRGLFDTLIRAAMVAALVAACYQVFSPFLSLVVWSVILAINFYPLQLMLKAGWWWTAARHRDRAVDVPYSRGTHLHAGPP
jgi:predicted PurR-regulated permease PerM